MPILPLLYPRRAPLGAMVVAWLCLAAGVVPGVWATSPEGGKNETLGANPTRDVMQTVMGEVLPPGTDKATLPEPDSAGARVLQTYCVQCHALPSPGLHTGDEWPAVVSRMQERIARLSEPERATIQAKPPNTSELTELLRYLKKYGYQPIDVARYPDLDTDIGRSFRQVCAQCHALPDPVLHSADEWLDVVARMRRNMELLGVDDPGEDALAKLLGFLQAHGRK